MTTSLLDSLPNGAVASAPGRSGMPPVVACWRQGRLVFLASEDPDDDGTLGAIAELIGLDSRFRAAATKQLVVAFSTEADAMEFSKRWRKAAKQAPVKAPSTEEIPV